MKTNVKAIMLNGSELTMDDRSYLEFNSAIYHDKVQAEAMKLIKTAKAELETKYKEEQEKLAGCVGRMRQQTEIVIRRMGRAAGEYGQQVSRDKDRELQMIKREIGRKHRKELRASKPPEIQVLQVIVEDGPPKDCFLCFLDYDHKRRVLELDEMPVCGACAKSVSDEMGLCGGCETTWYCNEACQEEDWETHQDKCTGSYSESENALRN